MQVLAGWTSLRGVVWANAAGTVEGDDACHAAPAVAGAAVPTTPGFVQTHGPPVQRGSPHTLDLGSAAQAPNAIAIDWASIVGGSFAGATVNWPADPWPSGAQWADPSYWPVIVVEGDLTLPTDGRGLLAVNATGTA
jgi:hypothetical protein